MASTLDLYIDASTGQLIEGGSVIGGALPTLTRNDSYILRLRLLEKQTNGLYEDIDLTSSSLKAGIGTIEDEPSAGSFKLAINGITSSAIPFNATAVCVYNAISNNVSTVALYGTDILRLVSTHGHPAQHGDVVQPRCVHPYSRQAPS
jgi:hypothetical protein